MKLTQDLFMTAMIAVLFSFLVAKLISMAMSGGDHSTRVSKKRVVEKHVKEEIVMEELSFFDDKLNSHVFRSEKGGDFVQGKTGFVAEIVENPDLVLVGEVVREGEGVGLIEESVEKLSGGGGGGSVVVGEIEEVVSKKEGDFDQELVKGGEKFETLIEKSSIEEEDSIGFDVVEERESKLDKVEEKKVEIVSSDDDWEGIERSELEKEFARAVKFVESSSLIGDAKDHEKSAMASVGSDLQMELYGLHKIATEGPCLEQPPMPLMVLARSKWNSWQRLGNMSPEAAMEQYIARVSEAAPLWMEEKSTGQGESGLLDAASSGLSDSISSVSVQEVEISDKRIPDLKTSSEIEN